MSLPISRQQSDSDICRTKQKGQQQYVCVFLCLNLTQLKGGPGVRLDFQFHFHPLNTRAEGENQRRIVEAETLPGNTWTPPQWCHSVPMATWSGEGGVGQPCYGSWNRSPTTLAMPAPWGSVHFLSALTQMGTEPFKLVDRPITVGTMTASDGENIDSFLMQAPRLSSHVY